MHPYEEKQNEYFTGRLKKYGYSHKSLSWESPFTQNARFIELLKICTMGSKLKDISLLDFGCGLGHLYKFIKDNGLLGSWGIDYTGADINEAFINEARKKMSAARFIIKDNDIYARSFDYVVCSGIYNLKFSEEFDIAGHYLDELQKLFDGVACGVAVNFQTNNAMGLIPKRLRNEEMRKFYFHDPTEVQTNLKKITGSIRISENYLPGNYDVTFYLLK